MIDRIYRIGLGVENPALSHFASGSSAYYLHNVDVDRPSEHMPF